MFFMVNSHASFGTIFCVALTFNKEQQGLKLDSAKAKF